MEWLEHDDVSDERLPSWARGEGEIFDGSPYRVTVQPEGLVLRRGRAASALRWEQILVPIRLTRPSRLLVSAARQPPRPPWFELGGRDVEALDQAVRTRLDALRHRGYREPRRSHEVVPTGEILRRVLERRALPGAVEIPAASPSVVRSAGLGGLVAGLTVGFYGLMVGPSVGLVAGVIGAATGAGLMGVVEAVRKRTVGRVLVLTPDGFVGGLDGRSVRAVAWERVGRFEAGRDLDDRPALEVHGPDGELVARVAARWFGAPLDVIVAVAEAYRGRATAPRA